MKMVNVNIDIEENKRQSNFFYSYSNYIIYLLIILTDL